MAGPLHESTQKPDSQALFPIVQGTLYSDLRIISANDHLKRDVRGFAVGGLRSVLFVLKWCCIFFHKINVLKKLFLITSGGESKDDFWKVVHLCTDILPENRPRYLMGVGFATDLVICCALGIDMFDCVFPTRTAVSFKIAKIIINCTNYLNLANIYLM